MYNKRKLEYVCALDLSMINKNEIFDVSQINIDFKLPPTQRLIKFLDDIDNPYCFLVGSIAVKIEFSDHGNTLQTQLKNHFIEHRNHNDG